MLVRVAEESFDKGMEAMEKGHRDEALAFFEAAIALEKQFGSGSPQPRYGDEGPILQAGADGQVLEHRVACPGCRADQESVSWMGLLMEHKPEDHRF